MAKEYADFTDEVSIPDNDEEGRYEVKVELEVEGQPPKLIDVRGVRFDHMDRRVVIETE